LFERVGHDLVVRVIEAADLLVAREVVGGAEDEPNAGAGTGEHLESSDDAWFKESGGRHKGGSATGKGNPYIGATLGEAAAAVGRTQTFLGAKLRRLVRHIPRKKAQGAVMRTQLVAAHALLSDPAAEYSELGPGYHDQRADTQRQARGHIRSLERLGYKVTLEPVDPETGELTAKAS
jgi:hypothetical protein